jgi:hypothetical protein
MVRICSNSPPKKEVKKRPEYLEKIEIAYRESLSQVRDWGERRKKKKKRRRKK